jgi:uncharacterized protein
MFIGVLQFELLVHDSTSLKDKRRVVRSVKDRLHREHMVSVAEVSAQDKLGVAVMGLTLSSPTPERAKKVIDAIVGKLRCLTDAELGVCRREILSPTREEELEGSDEPMPVVTDLERRMLSGLEPQGEASEEDES